MWAAFAWARHRRGDVQVECHTNEVDAMHVVASMMSRWLCGVVAVCQATAQFLSGLLHRHPLLDLLSSCKGEDTVVGLLRHHSVEAAMLRRATVSSACHVFVRHSRP